MTLLASRLKLGDTIGVFTPSGEIDDSPSESPYEELEKGTRYLEKLGFKVVLGENALKRGYFGAGTPQERADDINHMFANPDIHALIRHTAAFMQILYYLIWIMILFGVILRSCWVSAMSAPFTWESIPRLGL